jgi:ornithine carbamoyltransferase
MKSTHALQPYDAPTSVDMSTLLQQARSLQSAASAGTLRPLLRGKNIGLLCDSPGAGPATLFCDAALELGAHVAHVRPSLSSSSSAQEVRHTAHMLGRLYDALECQGMDGALVAQVAREAGVPVYDGISQPDHPTAALAEMLHGSANAELARRYVVQAILLRTIF